MSRLAGLHTLQVNALNKANICPGFKFAITYSRGDPSEKSNEAVDVGMYPSGYVPQAPKGKSKSAQNDWSFVEICIECKTEPEALDPFDDRNDDKQPTSKDRKGVLGQILSYAEFVLTRQQRTCLFMVLLLGDLCRLVRFDRSGAIASEKFNYKTNGGDLIEFLWRYARCDLATRGHDPSAERIDPASNLGQRMQARATKKPADAGPEDYVRELFEKSLKTDWSWWKLRVDGEHGVVRHFLVGEPNFQAPGVAGRGTRGYVALDADNIDGQFYYLKDAWRVVSRQIDKEGKILQFLNKKGVKYIPTLECHGDIAMPTIQLTKTNQLWKDLHKRKTGAVSPFKKHQHYRIVVKEVGQEMAKFERGRQLIHALWCCIFGTNLRMCARPLLTQFLQRILKPTRKASSIATSAPATSCATLTRAPGNGADFSMIGKWRRIQVQSARKDASTTAWLVALARFIYCSN